VRRRVKPAEVDHGLRLGVTTADRQRIAELDRIRELRRANEILKAASAFFARELDSRGRLGWSCVRQESPHHHAG
jgi:transposase